MTAQRGESQKPLKGPGTTQGEKQLGSCDVKCVVACRRREGLNDRREVKRRARCHKASVRCPWRSHCSIKETENDPSPRLRDPLIEGTGSHKQTPP